MKNRSTPSRMTWLAAGLALLLLALAILQYRWLGQVSDAERAQLRASLQRRGQEFALELHREIARAYTTFQATPLSEEQDVTMRLAEAWRTWTRDSRYPRLISELYFLEPSTARAAERLSRFDPASGSLTTTDWPAALAPLRSYFGQEREEIRTENGVMTTIVRRHPPLVEDVPAIVVPAIRVEPSGRGRFFTVDSTLASTIALIDVEYLRRDLLPLLTERHFNPAAHQPEFVVSVVKARTPLEIIFQSGRTTAKGVESGGSRAVDHPDLRLPLFDFRPEEMARVLFETRRPSTALRAGPSTGSTAGPSTTVAATETRTGQFRIALGVQRPDAIARVAPSSAAWQLLVMHRAGSIDAAISAARTRNLTISFGILVLFGASIALLIVSTERARRLAQRQIEFVAAVSHELRTPLAVIRSAGENLADGVVSEPAQIENYGRLIEQQGRSLSDMVEQVLAFAGAENGSRLETRQTVDLAELLSGVIETSRQLAGPSFTFDRTIDAPLPPILGQPDALRRVFQNLIDNAVKYSNGAKWVGVAASVRGQNVVVCISDRGIGIEPAEQRHIFEPFYRGRQATAAQIHGSGLGLSLVWRIVQAHGGQVEVASSPGEGSTFRVSFPIAESRLATTEPESCPGSSSSKTNPESS